jgi:hypothetical protein
VTPAARRSGRLRWLLLADAADRERTSLCEATGQSRLEVFEHDRPGPCPVVGEVKRASHGVRNCGNLRRIAKRHDGSHDQPLRQLTRDLDELLEAQDRLLPGLVGRERVSQRTTARYWIEAQRAVGAARLLPGRGGRAPSCF